MHKPIRLDFELDVIEKAEDGEKSRKIFGYASTEKLDKQGEILVQKGLDFSPFLKDGWFNDNHDRTTAGVIGYPEKAEFHEGRGWYVEGYLLKGYRKADEIWELASALKKSNSARKLGFSVEGGQATRMENRVVKCAIKNVAVTHCPVNTDCTMDVLVKSLQPEEDSVDKALEAGYQQSTDMTGGSALRTQDLDKTKSYNQELSPAYCEKCHKPCTCIKKSIQDEKDLLEKIAERGYSTIQVDAIYKKLFELQILKPLGGN